MKNGRTISQNSEPSRASELAVALDYEREEMDAPALVASGRAEIAAEMRKIAARYGVPIVNEPELAEKLAAGRFDSSIEESLFTEVAEVLLGIESKQNQLSREEINPKSPKTTQASPKPWVSDRRVTALIRR